MVYCESDISQSSSSEKASTINDSSNYQFAHETSTHPTNVLSLVGNNFDDRVAYHINKHPLYDIKTHRHLTKNLIKQHYGELSVQEKYLYDLSRAQLKASSRTSALLAGFAMVALVELQYTETTPRPLLIILAVVTTLLVSVHLLALMMSTCILPYIEANGCTKDSPHKRLKFYIELSWFFSTCIGLLLFLVEIEVILFVKFDAVHYLPAAYITAAILVPVFVIFIVFSCLIHKNRMSHSMERAHSKMDGIEQYVHDAESDQFVGNPLLRGDMSRQMFDISPNSSIHHDLQSQGEMVEMKNVVKVV